MQGGFTVAMIKERWSLGWIRWIEDTDCMALAFLLTLQVLEHGYRP